ncbi:MAG: glycolate oxidase subunit GlcF [Rhodospirillales bacterium]|jgi:glycolate oxidase iron-sulfur subunit|nr:glycolate oxidase subunit GlcF [Rhodospirillales bacterium]MDP6884081.1 glycolate oxidase subunit GlcF [Rhodospirillales bacterium]
MRTNFSEAQLADPDIRRAAEILRHCVECGAANATCPSYLVLNDENDSPRGRNRLIRDMLQGVRPPDSTTVGHIDRCLSCNACTALCLAKVDFMHLIDQARKTIERTYRRPWPDRLLRGLLAAVLPSPGLFRLALAAARLARPFTGLMPGRLRGMARLAPRRAAPSSPIDRPQVIGAERPRRMRVALLTGCVQQVLEPAINEATVRLLTRHGCEVVVAEGAGCCGALTHHLGKTEPTEEAVRANVAAWIEEADSKGLDAIVVNASGCGTMVKDYGHVLAGDPAWAERGARIAALARDVTEVMAELGLRSPVCPEPLSVAYHPACSLHHAQKVRNEPKRLLADCGFDVKAIPESHVCCGSAGSYSLLQPAVAERLKERKAERIGWVAPDVVAAGNIGCMVQIAAASEVPVVHTAELLDWATGGPKPPALSG